MRTKEQKQEIVNKVEALRGQGYTIDKACAKLKVPKGSYSSWTGRDGIKPMRQSKAASSRIKVYTPTTNKSESLQDFTAMLRELSTWTTDAQFKSIVTTLVTDGDLNEND